MLNQNVPRKLVIFGSGMMAELSDFYFTHDSDFEVVAFTLDDSHRQTDEYLGKPCVDFSKVQELYPPTEYSMFIAVGYSKLNEVRIAKYEQAKAKGYRLASYISSKSSYWPENLNVGENVMIMEGNTIMPFCTIEDNVVCFIGNILAHHAHIGKHTTFTSHIALGGCVVVGERCFFGLNSTIRDSITIAPGTVIGTASNVLKDTEPFSVYMGNPAKKVASSDSIKL